MKEWANPDIEHPILAGKIITSTRVKYDVKLLTTFLKDIISGKYNDIKVDILNRLSKIKGGHYMRNEDVEYFPYGFDELYTNYYLSKDLLKYKHLVYYDIVFKELSYMYNIPEFKEMKSYDDNIWRGINREKNHSALLKISNKIYSQIPVKNKCLQEFHKYKNKTVSKNYVWGLTTLIQK
jgi:hypothetical protein